MELRLHGFSSGAEGDYWPQVVSGFNARQAKSRVTFEPYAPDKGVLVLGAAGTLGDVMRLVGFADYAQVAARGFLKDLAPLIAHDRFDLKPFYPAAVETLKFRGKQYGLPLFAHPGFCAHFVNTDAFARSGAALPDDAKWTLDDLERTARQLSGPARGEEGGRWGIWPPTSIQHVMVAARAFGGDTLSRDGKRSLIADPASAQGVQFIADLIHKARAAPVPGSLPGTDVQNLLSGQVAITWTNVGIVNTLKKQAQGVPWQALLGPKGPGARGTNGSRGFFMGVDAPGMNAATKYPDQAFELVKYIVSKEVSLGWFDVGFPPGGRHDTWNDPRIVADPAFKVLARAMDEATPFHMPDNGLIADYNAALGKELAGVWSGQVSAKDGVEAARRAGQEVLDRPLVARAPGGPG